LEHVLRYIKVKGTPVALPETIEVNVAELDIGQTLHVSDVQIPEGIELLGNLRNPVVSISKPRVAGEESAADDASSDEAASGDGETAEGSGEGASE